MLAYIPVNTQHTAAVSVSDQRDVTMNERHTHTLSFLFNWPIFPQLIGIRLLQVRLVPKSKLLEIVSAVLLQARWTFYYPINSVKAPKDKNNVTMPLKYSLY